MDLIRTLVFIVAIFSAGCTTVNSEVEPGIIVSTDWLQLHQEDTSLVILHLGNREVFDTVHIPGSRFIDPQDFTVTKNELRNEVPTMSVISKLLKSVGVNRDSKVVLYWESKDLISRTARVFLTLDYAGIGDRTFVLDGGLPGWINENGEGSVVMGHSPGTHEIPPVTKGIGGTLELGAPREVVLWAQELNQLCGDPDYVIVDTRSQDEYDGTSASTGSEATGGHIEGAYFMNYKSLLTESSPCKFREDVDLEREFEKAGLGPDKTGIYYCGSGMRASVSYLVARHLGYPALLFDGSYQEWERLDLPLITTENGL